LQRLTSEIIAFIPIVFNKTSKTFIPPNDSLQLKLLKMLLQKELHECQNHYVKKRHILIKKIWKYFRPQYED
jgi:hypothetical protein